ncbi:MAG: ribonuclease Z [Gemmatimonadota bacterium]
MSETVLTTVGTGTLLPSAARVSTGHLVETPGRSVLLDCGSGVLHGLARCHASWAELDVVALSHFHPDHLVDFPALLAAYRFRRRERPLTVIGPPGVTGMLDKMAALYGEWMTDGGVPLRVVPLSAGEVWRSDEVALEAYPVHHTEESVAYRVETPHGVVGYTGDTGVTAGLGGWLRGCRILLAECALPDPPAMDTHLSPSGLANLVDACLPELVVVTHVYPPIEPADMAAAVAARISPRPGASRPAVVAARDGGRVRMTPYGVTVDPAGGPV